MRTQTALITDYRYSVKNCRVQSLREEPIAEYPLLDTPESAYNYWCAFIANPDLCPQFNPDVENSVCIILNTRRRSTGFFYLSSGTLDTCLLHPREVYRGALVANASAIILAHNHPSGDPTPSEADIRVTRELIRAGQLLKVELLDHIVIGRATTERKQAYVSLRELGYF